MMRLSFSKPGESLSVLCIGAHCDDIEIGAGATILGWIESGIRLHVHWAVLGARGVRGEEAWASAASFLSGAASSTIDLGSFRDGFFPSESQQIKEWFEGLKDRVNPDLILSHWRDDGHQDHREVSRLTWNTFRDHTILEYEIPKWDGDMGQPNVYVPATKSQMDRKVELLNAHFGTQRSKHWFDPDTFRALARLRGMECRAPERFAEAYFARKLSF